MTSKILEYQEIDAQLKEIENSLSQSEEKKKAVSAQTFLKSVSDNVARLDQRADDLVIKFNALSRLYEKLKDSQSEYEQIVESCEDVNEIAYIKKKAQELTDELTRLAADMESVSNDISAVLKEFAQIKAKRKTAKAQYDEFAPKYKELKEAKDAEGEKIKAKLKKLEKDIPSDLLELYQKKRNEKIFPILYSAKQTGKSSISCGRCNTEFPGASAADLRNGKIVECDSCHRLIYFEADKK